jgi:hypothetical protein
LIYNSKDVVTLVATVKCDYPCSRLLMQLALMAHVFISQFRGGPESTTGAVPIDSWYCQLLWSVTWTSLRHPARICQSKTGFECHSQTARATGAKRHSASCINCTHQCCTLQFKAKPRDHHEAECRSVVGRPPGICMQPVLCTSCAASGQLRLLPTAALLVLATPLAAS